MVDRSSKTSDLFIQQLTEKQLPLRVYIFSALGNHAHGQDVLQKTNLALWRKADEYDPERPFLPWAMGIARFEVLAFFRDRQRDRHLFEPDVAEAMLSRAAIQMDELPARQAALRRCVSEIAPEHRQWLDLRYLRGGSLAEIAEKAGRTVDSVKSAMMRVRKSLRKCIERRLIADEG